MIQYTRQRQAGLTLVELMVSLVLGLFITTAVVQLFSGSKRSYNINEAMARVQENGRFAMSFLLYDARMADYSVDPGSIREPDPDAVIGENDSGLNQSDTVSMVYDEIEGGITVEKTYSYSILTSKSGRPSLFRSVDGGDAVEVAEGIENLQILYGEDTDDDYIPDHYVDWTSVVDRTKVVALRITVTVQTLTDNVASAGGRLTKNFSSAVVLRNRLP